MCNFVWLFILSSYLCNALLEIQVVSKRRFQSWRNFKIWQGKRKCLKKRESTTYTSLLEKLGKIIEQFFTFSLFQMKTSCILPWYLNFQLTSSWLSKSLLYFYTYLKSISSYPNPSPHDLIEAPIIAQLDFYKNYLIFSYLHSWPA